MADFIYVARYWRSVFREAFRSAWTMVVGHTVRTLLVSAGVFILSTVAYGLFSADHKTAMKEYFIAGLSGVVGVAVIYVSWTFFYALFWWPAIRAREHDRVIHGLEGKIRTAEINHRATAERSLGQIKALEARNKQLSSPNYDMAEGEFVLRVRSAIRADADLFEIEETVRQQARDGILEIWGRDIEQFRALIEPIKKGYFSDHGFEATLSIALDALDSDSVSLTTDLIKQTSIIADRTPDRTKYTDLHFNREQVHTLWPLIR